ncbi:MAG: hypothetical protein HOV68_07220 [Streptomycetaceae bacterium]|nr:hypothetical protein [Streptomycetaceae bacterium]
MDTQDLAAGMALPITLSAIAVLLIAGLLIWPVVRGVTRRRPPPPRDPRPSAWSAHDDNVSAAREPYEVPRDGIRHTPHHLAGYGTLGSRPREEHPQPGAEQEPPADDERRGPTP